MSFHTWIFSKFRTTGVPADRLQTLAPHLVIAPPGGVAARLGPRRGPSRQGFRGLAEALLRPIHKARVPRFIEPGNFFCQGAEALLRPIQTGSAGTFGEGNGRLAPPLFVLFHPAGWRTPETENWNAV